MTALSNPKNPGWPSVTQYEVTERLLGGPGGPLNRAPAELLERTEFLKKQIDDIVSGALVAEYADRLKTPRNIAMTGDGSWNVNFDGNGNVSGALTLANSGVAAGSYGQVTVDVKGRVTAARAIQPGDVPGLDWSKISSGKPTTLAGYGITDAALLGGATNQTFSVAPAVDPQHAVPLAQMNKALSGKADKANTLAGYGIKDAALLGGSTGQIFNVAPAFDPQHAVPLAQMDKALSGKADKAATLAGYGIADGVSTTTFNEAVSRLNRQSTELTPGLSAVATMGQVMDGADDTAHITPKKIKWGFRASLTTNGFIQFPSWLGGFMIQWVTGDGQVIGPNTYLVGRKSNWITSFTGSCLKVMAIPGSIQSIVGVNSFDNEGVVPYLGNLASQGSVTVVPIFIGIGN